VPGHCVLSFARAVGGAAFVFSRKHKKIALDSLAISFGKEKSRQEMEGIARECFTFLAKSAFELISLLDKPELIKEQVTFSGRENLDAALSKGYGVILVSAHFGNFPLMLARIRLEGYKVSGIMRPMRDTRVENFFAKKRDRFGIKTIYSVPRRVCVEETLKTLRGNELIFIPLDQNFGTGGVFVDFFGKKAATATGPVVLALRTKSSIIPAFIVRQKDDTHRIIFEKAMELEEGKTGQDTVVINIQKLTGIIESYIRKYPAEWGWIHRRWKSRPNLEEEHLKGGA
ncbi:MAG: lysophospholipid acyltransferase family protein, partial [Candidatus Omnitrophica bacterium]|nr:lysophospholipid acyltransferase family protein [Candidatus Omnitrophota bacterium]